MESEKQARTIIAVDIEADGPVPGVYSMLALGAAAYDWEQNELGAFEVHLEPWPGAGQHKATMEWWQKQPEAWAHVQTDRVERHKAMSRFFQWLKPFEPVVYLCGPVGFDFVFLRWYAVQYGFAFPHNAIDLRSYVMGVTGSDDYYGNVKGGIRKLTGLPRAKHTHKAMEDARELAGYFFAIRKLRQDQDLLAGKRKVTGIVMADKRGVDDPALQEIRDEVMRIFDQEPGEYLITDMSKISDFASFPGDPAARKAEIERYYAEITGKYGIEIPEGGYFVDVFRAILDSRRLKN